MIVYYFTEFAGAGWIFVEVVISIGIGERDVGKERKGNERNHSR